MSSPIDPHSRPSGGTPPQVGPRREAETVRRHVPPGVDPVEPVDEGDASYLRYRAEDRSIGEIASEVLDNASDLVRKEIALAKAEATLSAKKAGTGAGLFAAAAAFGLMVLVALTLAMWWAIAVLIGTVDEPAPGLSGVIVAVIWAVIAAILAFAGKSQFDKMEGLEQTQETIQKIPNAATGHEERNR